MTFMRVAVVVLVFWSFLVAMARSDYWLLVFLLGFVSGAAFGVYCTIEDQDRQDREK